MSRIGVQPIQIPQGVDVSIQHQRVTVRGPKGEQSLYIQPSICVKQHDGSLIVERRDDTRQSRALHGLTRSLCANMIHGVVDGWEKKVELHGVGYRAAIEGETLRLSVGFSHPVMIKPPEGISFSVKGSTVTIQGIDKASVGQVAANIRKVRPPEPYKGKGIRYVGEHIRRKAGKTAVGEGAVKGGVS